MANGYYMMDVQPVNTSTQSAVAMASYRSGEKLYSLKDGETKKYKERFVQPDNFILKPDNAPEWTLERERLWNEVEKNESHNNAQIARNVLLPLPNDMTHDQQKELAQEYIQENFVDEGMVADVSIHRDDVNNPHAHVLLTVREFDQEGNWEKRKSKRVPVLDDEGNQKYNEKGWKMTRSVKLNDWDKKSTLLKWRENWAEKLNEKSLKFGLNKEYSHKSFEEQGRLKKAEIRLTRSEYQFEKKIKKEAEKNNEEYKPTTHYAKKNEEIKQYNEQLNDIVHLEDYKVKKDYKSHLDQLRKDVHVNEDRVEATQLLVQRAKGYVDYKVAKNLYDDFNNDRNKWKLNIERVETVNDSKKTLYSKLIEAHKKNPEIVKSYGYSVENFKDEMREDIAQIKNDEEKIAQQKEKFDELKQATVISLEYQKELLDMEFNSIYPDNDTNEYSYEEKYYALKLVKDHNIVLPDDKIKTEYHERNQAEDIHKNYVPVWQQAKDTMNSLEIYERTINKFNRQNDDEISPDELKEKLIKLSSFNALKKDYQDYLEDITPLINQEIQNILDNKVLNESHLQVKVAVLESYSKLSEIEKENLNVEDFVKNVQQEYSQKAKDFRNYGNNIEHEQDDNKDEKLSIINEGAKKSKEIAEGLLDVLKSLSQEQNLSNDTVKRDRTKVQRKRGTDGRVL